MLSNKLQHLRHYTPNLTLEQVVEKLSGYEPDYREAAKLGSKAMLHLEQLAVGNDFELAARAVYLASIIGGDKAIRLISNALQHSSPDVRIQAVASAVNLPIKRATRIIREAMDDPSVRVKVMSLKSVKAIFPRGNLPKSLAKKTEAISHSDTTPVIRELSDKLMQQHKSQ